MSVPDWLVPILQQFPIVTLARGSVGIGAWWLNKRHKEELQRIEKMHADAHSRADAEIVRLRADLASGESRHLAELARATDLYAKQIDDLRERVRELETQAPRRKGGT